jgi:hypothetical protein
MASHYTNGSTGHKGVERRMHNRRNISERRKDIRWEPNNPNRRQTAGRRVMDHLGVNGKR